MAKKFLMGNEAIGLGAVRAGVRVVTGYPGTPSSEILETVAKYKKENNINDMHVEWSVNEKAALEVAAGASYAGERVLVTMKQVGLNVASDPLMSLTYVGINGGMVIVAADDPGPISSQTEQDTRHFAKFAKLPVFDPASPEDAYEMISDAFEYSEKYKTPVLFRPTTRICHGCAVIETDDGVNVKKAEGFVKDSSKWVIFPKLAYNNHIKIEEKLKTMSDDFSSYKFNFIRNKNSGNKRGVVSSGISAEYVKENLPEDIKYMQIATAHPFPEKLALEFLNGLSEVLVVEELDGVIENALVNICGKYHLNIDILGKDSGSVPNAGENTLDIVKNSLYKFLGRENTLSSVFAGRTENMPPLPIRPPVLCAGCPHRASFYAVKKAMQGRKAVFSGDIGCYTLGNAKPLDMVDTCLCMGAGITIAQGLHISESDSVNFAFIGDSTFFASGITGVVNAVYNKNDIVLIVLDNSTTAMTGHQPHPGTGFSASGEIAQKINIAKVLEAVGVQYIKTVNPLDYKTAVETIKEAAELSGVRAVIFKSPCIALFKKQENYEVNDKCVNCRKCIKELGCPAISISGGKVKIESSLCYGCGLCAKICPCEAIVKTEGDMKNE